MRIEYSVSFVFIERRVLFEKSGRFEEKDRLSLSEEAVFKLSVNGNRMGLKIRWEMVNCTCDVHL